MQPDHNGESALNQRTLAKIHIAKKVLGLDDGDYQALLERVTGCRSARDILPDQVPDLQREFRRLGWQGWLLRRDEITLKYSDCDNRPDRPNAKQLRYLEAMFKNIAGYAQAAPDAAFRGFLKKRFGVSDARFLDSETFDAALHAVREMRRRYGTKDGSDPRGGW